MPVEAELELVEGHSINESVLTPPTLEVPGGGIMSKMIYPTPYLNIGPQIVDTGFNLLGIEDVIEDNEAILVEKVGELFWVVLF